MDKIQKVLVKAGRKDLAQEYYKKVAANNSIKETFTNINVLISHIKQLDVDKGIRATLLKIVDKIDSNVSDSFKDIKSQCNGVVSYISRQMG